MSLIDLASGKSLWRGMDYFRDDKVICFEKINDNEYKSIVKGNGDNEYSVHIDLAHARKSSCNCPFADGRRVICKHMVATYFAVFPDEAKRIYDEAIAYMEEEEQRETELEIKLEDYIHKLKKSELENILLQVLYDGPEWQYDRFLADYLDEY